MTSEYGHKLNPHRKLRKQKGIKGIRRTLFNTHVPSTIDQTGILAVRFPYLGKEDVIVPGTSKLSFKIQLNSDDDANRTIVNNLGRAIVSKLEDATSGKAQLESTQPEAGVKRSKKAQLEATQLVETQSREDNIFDM